MMNSKMFLHFVVAGLLFTAVVATPTWAQQATRPAAGGPRVADNAARPSAARPVGNPANRLTVNPMAPSWFPLTPQHQEHVNQVLAYWEFKSSQVKRYRCSFRRWDYDPVFGPQNTFNTFSEGVIKYSSPDKGLFRVEMMKRFTPPKQAGGQPDFLDVDKSQFDHWICDGEWVYYFDHQKKKLVQSQLPPDMRGKAIGRGPLPFLFNAKADDLKRRFWLRTVTPKGAVENEYHLEAIPRTQEEAANFKMIHVIIDRADYLPKAMVVYDTNYRPETPSRTTYEFNNREVNFNILAEKLNLFHREFYEPAVPSGWGKDVRRWNQSVAPATAQNPAGTGNTSR